MDVDFDLGEVLPNLISVRLRLLTLQSVSKRGSWFRSTRGSGRDIPKRGGVNGELILLKVIHHPRIKGS